MTQWGDNNDDCDWDWGDEKKEIIRTHWLEFDNFLKEKKMYDAYVDEENEMPENEKIELQEEYINEWLEGLGESCCRNIWRRWR
jgi:hypothetical protein